ncbi:kinase-like domain-containing protein [Mycena sanguinolenta]|nr:kinase-like domain-containing protein [Mycena sanguinolenta]
MACSTKVQTQSPREAAQLQATLDGYKLSMASENAVSGILESLECRRKLLEVSAKLGLENDPNLRGAFQKDEKRIATLLISIFTSSFLEEIALRLEGDPAQCFLDVVQSTLDQGLLIAEDHSRMARRILRKLSASCDILPSSLFITGITGKEQYPTFGGGYGDIYRALYGKQTVALKYMRAVQFVRGSELREIRLRFCREALLWKGLHHPHILPFLGIDQNNFPLSLVAVSPWMEHGTVVNHLKKHGHGHVDKLLYEIAQGLQYLHLCGIVHGDLRGTNILINEEWSACLADFGLSIFSDATASMTTNRGGSLYWMAPELLDPDRFGIKFIRTPASDVYAFGCVCVELYTGRPPFGGLPEPAALMKVISGIRRERPSSSPAMSDTLWQHVTEYWDQNPNARPVTQILVQNMVWPVPLQHPPSLSATELTMSMALPDDPPLDQLTLAAYPQSVLFPVVPTIPASAYIRPPTPTPSLPPADEADLIDLDPPYVYDPHTTYADPNVQAWAQYYAAGGTDRKGTVYFASVPGIKGAVREQSEQLDPPYVYDPHRTYSDPNVQAWAEYYAAGGTAVEGTVYFVNVPGVTGVYADPNVQAWAQYYAAGGTDRKGTVYFASVPGIKGAVREQSEQLDPPYE